MNMTEFEGYRYVDGGVCAAQGFQANGLNCGLNPDKNKNDLGMVFSKEPCETAAVYTQNKVKGAPILVTKKHLADGNGVTHAILVNSKNANTGNADGEKVAAETSKLAAEALGIDEAQVVVASTGVIGQPMPVAPFADHMKTLVDGLSESGHEKAATAIMTTDTVRKEVAVEFEIDGKKCHLGGMAKGSGMIHPNMATTLNFITSDVAISHQMIQKALDEIVKITYNCLSIDGDTSTNDMVSVMANGLAGNNKITEKNSDYDTFKEVLFIVCRYLARKMAADGEGASKLFEAKVINAGSKADARTLARAIVASNLSKAAIYGCDANFGRFLCAMGYSGASFDQNNVELFFESEAGKLQVFDKGTPLEFDEDKAVEILKASEVTILVDMHEGSEEATAWGCDLTYDYVKINADYRS